MKLQHLYGAAGAAVMVFSLGACASIRETIGFPRPDSASAESKADAKAELVASLPASPEAAPPTTAAAERVWKRALADRKLRLVVSTHERTLWLVRDTTPIFRAPIAVGSSKEFTYRGKTWDFTTPVGVRKVLGRATGPLWVPPDWHYYELAVDQKLEPVRLKAGSKVTLADGTRIEVRGKQVGRVNEFGNFWPFRPGAEIVFDGKIFIPPYGTDQRQVPEILGTHKLELGDGYLIHGTNEEGSIGEAVSHGCVRMFNEDVAELYAMVPNGTPVYIY